VDFCTQAARRYSGKKQAGYLFVFVRKEKRGAAAAADDDDDDDDNNEKVGNDGSVPLNT
jgi:hypothetical protein